MKHVNASTSEMKELVGSLKSQIRFDNASKDKGSIE
jgi:hypothetical protein